MTETSTYWQFITYWDLLLEPITTPQERQELYPSLWNDLSDYWRVRGPPSFDTRDKRRNEFTDLPLPAVKRQRC
jgi:hypothetical protein